MTIVVYAVLGLAVAWAIVKLNALHEIRDLFAIGAEAQSKLQAASPDGGLAIEALLRSGAARLTTRWKVDEG